MNSTTPFEKDRRIIFPTERNTAGYFFDAYCKSKNKPLVLVFSNPPPYLIRIGIDNGIPPEKITCPCEPDLSRFLACVPPSILEEDIKGIKFSQILPLLLTGVHGDPRLIYAPEYQEFMRKHSSELDAALEKSVEMANRAARSRYGISRTPDVPPQTNVHFFQDFARFRSSMGNFHLSREFRHNRASYKGVAMYPANVCYKKDEGITVVLNKDKVEEIGRPEFDAANAVYLAGQKDFYERTMGLETPTNVGEDVSHFEKLGFRFVIPRYQLIKKLRTMK